jgi:tetratricopeptide (TPR) repeat protein
MNRYIVVAAAIVLALILGAVALSMRDRPTEIDYRLAQGRAHLDAENYLAVLKTLRDIPASQNKGPETHSYLGAAYLRLHLYQAAIREFEEAVKLRPRRSDPWIGLASSYIELGDGQKAVDEAKRATDVEKGSADAWITLGRAQWQQKNFDEAEKAGLKARELNPQNLAASDLLLHVYFDRNQPDKFQAELDRNSSPTKGIQDLAVRFFIRQGQFARAYELKTRYEKIALDRSILETELALQREPARMEQYPQFIRDLVRAGRFAEAIDAAKTYRGPVMLDLELGKSYWTTARKDDAIQSFRRASAGLIHKLSAEVALAAITGDIQHWKEAYRAERIEQDYFVLSRIEDILPKASPMVRAFVYRYAGIFDASFYTKAAEEANHVLDQDPENFDALMTLGTAYHRLGRLDDATRYVELARQVYPKSAEPLSRLANLEVSRQGSDPRKIVDLMEQAVKFEPNNASYLFNLGWTYDQLGETKKAADLYQRAIRASPLSFEAMNNLALMYGSGGEPDRALPLLEQAVRTDPENEAVYFNFANYHVRRRDWKPAIENYDRALQLNPANSAAAVEKGRIFLELARTEDALVSLNHALEIDTHSFDAYMLLSSAYEKMGHIKEAIAALEEARRIRSNAPEVTAALDRLKDTGARGATNKTGARSATNEKDSAK